MTPLDQAAMDLDRARSAVVNAIAKRLGVDRSYRLWHEVESEARDAVTAWTRRPRTPSDEFERMLEDARRAEVAVAAAKAVIRAEQGAGLDQMIAKLNPARDPDRVYLTLRCEKTRSLVRITLPADAVEVLSPEGTAKPLDRPVLAV